MTLIVIAIFTLIAILVACGAPLLLTLAAFALIAIFISVFMLVKGFPPSVDTNEAAKEGRFDLRSLELRRRSAQSRARLAALLAPKHRPKRRGITNW